MDLLVRTIREDGHKASCVIKMDDAFAEWFKNKQEDNPFDDSYDDEIDTKVMEKIYFEALGFIVEDFVDWAIDSCLEYKGESYPELVNKESI